MLSISQRGWSLCQWPAPTVTRGFLPGVSGRSLHIVRKDRVSMQHLVSYQVNLVDRFVSLVKEKPRVLLVAPLGLTGIFDF